MKRTIAMLALFFVVLSAVAYADFRDVTCGWPYCKPGQLQDEFNEVDHRMDDIEGDVSDLECEVSGLHNDVQKLENKDRKQDIAIGMNYLWDMKQQKEIKSLIQTIDDNSAKWEKDTVGGGGWSRRGVQQYLLGDWFDELENVRNYMDILKLFFVTKEEHAALEQRVDYLEAKLNVLEKYLDIEIQEDDAFICSQKLIEANRLGEPVRWGNGWSAFPGKSSCMQIK